MHRANWNSDKFRQSDAGMLHSYFMSYIIIAVLMWWGFGWKKNESNDDNSEIKLFTMFFGHKTLSTTSHQASPDQKKYPPCWSLPPLGKYWSSLTNYWDLLAILSINNLLSRPKERAHNLRSSLREQCAASGQHHWLRAECGCVREIRENEGTIFLDAFFWIEKCSSENYGITFTRTVRKC